jgi:hypothetical protein
MPSDTQQSPPTPAPSQPEGRARSAMNALRHGLTARIVVLPSEDMAVYVAISKEIVDSLDAQTPLERQFAQTVADNQWRINRIRTIEDALLATVPVAASDDQKAATDPASPEMQSACNAAQAFREHSKSLLNLSIYEQRLHRAVKDALSQLKELQTARSERRKLNMDWAIRLSKAQKMRGFPYNPQADGFVFANAQIDTEIRRRERLDHAIQAERVHFNLATYARYDGIREDMYENRAA